MEREPGVDIVYGQSQEGNEGAGTEQVDTVIDQVRRHPGLPIMRPTGMSFGQPTLADDDRPLGRKQPIRPDPMGFGGMPYYAHYGRIDPLKGGVIDPLK
ncbi:hypothetical protein KBD59_03390 [Candidatus Gracilibacteria bacterium]|nr:hypothetical protein [Candidatus Gracilibacteria bacterium]